MVGVGELLGLPSHGGGHEFESRRVHFPSGQHSVWSTSRFRPLDEELECYPRSPSPDQHAERQLGRGMAPQDRPRPPHERYQEESRQSPRPEDVNETYRRAGDAGGVEREVRQRCEEGEEECGEGVGEEGGLQRGGSAEEGDDQEGPGVQHRDDPQGTHPLGLWDAAGIADLARAREVEEVDEREAARQEQTEKSP
jgi:hypothetical protein